MFRTAFSILVCVSAVQSANPENSDITYVKIQPITGHDTPQTPYTSIRESRIENLPLTIRNFHEESIRKIRSDEPTTHVDISEPFREENRDSTAESTKTKETPTEIETATEEQFSDKQKLRPRFYSKLSYFSKPAQDFDSSLSTNLVDARSGARSGGRKKFRSRCRCERIWNCPRLQITVPRCPQDYFMCCF